MAKRTKSPAPLPGQPPVRPMLQPSDLTLAVTRSDRPQANAGEPLSGRAQALVSLVLIAHFGALLVTWSANLAPSYLQGNLTALLSPYLVTTTQAYNAFPLELTHAEPFDFPMHIQLLATDEQRGVWQFMALPGLGDADSSATDNRFSRWSNYSRVIRLVASEQPDSEILSDIAASAVRYAEQRSGQTYRAIRWVAPKILSYDEDALVRTGQLIEGEGELSPQIVYSAAVLRDAAGGLSLIPEQAPLRTAKPVRRTGGLP
jgi:hypothetical protein